MKYLSPYHESCAKTFAFTAFQTLSVSTWSTRSSHPTVWADVAQLWHKLDIEHCVHGFIGEVMECLQTARKIYNLENGNTEFTNFADFAQHYESLLQEGVKELGDLCYYMAMLQTLLLNPPESFTKFAFKSDDVWGNWAWSEISEAFLQELTDGTPPQCDEVVESEKHVFDRIEAVLDKTKKLLFYGHEGNFNSVFDDMNFLLNWFRVFYFDKKDEESTPYTIEELQTLNQQKLAKRYTSGTFTPEEAAAKKDAEPTEEQPSSSVAKEIEIDWYDKKQV